ncbi:hypothetical protein OF83DRAFT_1141461 [Amylostereum chailletii]|nr:hypothetical protein OF83DRAFT_1141461 [Amylostereum chailletii]
MRSPPPVVHILPFTTYADRPPSVLPAYLFKFLCRMLSAPDTETIVAYWVALKDIVWMEGPCSLTPDEAERFQRYGRIGKDTRGMDLISDYIFYPPVYRCEKCNALLKRGSRFPVVFFTRNQGARAAYTTSLLCTDCDIRYHPNYYIVDSTRCYYGGVLAVIHLEDHALIETDVCEFFTMCMLFAWVSGQNCAKIYNATLSVPEHAQPPGWPQTFALSSEQVWRSVYIYALLRDHAERGEIFKDGQPHQMHACQTCERFIPSRSGDGHLGLRMPLLPRHHYQY